MPTIAQKLCSEIVNPLLEQRQNESPIIINTTRNPTYECPLRSTLTQKRKVINNIVPKGKSKIVLNKFKSRESIYRRFIDVSVNTIISGPLINNSNCLTNIRQRDKQCVLCKCNRTVRNDTKRVQTSHHFSQVEKACFQYLEMVTHSTQYLDTPKTDMEIATATFLNDNQNIPRPQPSKGNQTFYYNYSCGKRWALSKYPALGPDF